jgi:hypothetical protein
LGEDTRAVKRVEGYEISKMIRTKRINTGIEGALGVRGKWRGQGTKQEK